MPYRIGKTARGGIIDDCSMWNLPPLSPRSQWGGPDLVTRFEFSQRGDPFNQITGAVGVAGDGTTSPSVPVVFRLTHKIIWRGDQQNRRRADSTTQIDTGADESAGNDVFAAPVQRRQA